MIAPFAPHFASELWSGFLLAPGRLNNECIKWEAGVLEQSWPVLDPHYKLSLSCTVTIYYSMHCLTIPYKYNSNVIICRLMVVQ